MAASFTNISPDLIWECTRGHNAFLVKRAQAGGVQLSRDPMNLLNKHSRKYAGFVNPKAIGINPGPNGTMLVSSKVEKKTHQPAKAEHKQSFKASTPARKAYRSVAGNASKSGYRSDLRAEAVARASAIKKSQRPVKEVERPVQLRGGRKKKADAAAEASS